MVMSVVTRTISAQKRVIGTILNRLSASLRGQIFLCNLDASIENGLVDAKAVSGAFATVMPGCIRDKHEDDLLGHLRTVLQHPAQNLMLQHDQSPALTDFANSKPLVTVMRREDFETWYADPSDLISGHDFANRIPGSSTNKFSLSSTTNPVCWVAPTNAFSARAPLEKDAEAARDMLGLVHRGKQVSLVSLHFIPKSDRCFRPTAIESIPNARFRQLDPDHPLETRWGFTVDLELLDTTLPTVSLTGKPELVFPKIRLIDCMFVSFFHLGETRSDRDTASADKNFLGNLLEGRSISDIVSRLRKQLTP